MTPTLHGFRLTPPQAGFLACTLPSPLSPLLLCLLLLLAGCSKPDANSPQQPDKRPLEGLRLRLAVVDDPRLAAAVVRVQGEWNAQTGAELQVDQAPEKDLLEGKLPPADAVICPSHLLGVLAEGKLVAALPPAILHDPQCGGIFELLKVREAAWGREIMAVPFGSPVLTCYYRADLLTKLGRQPPRTWTEYQELAKLLAANSPLPLGEGQAIQNSPRPLGEGQATKSSPRPLAGEGQGVRAAWCGTIEPLAPGWAGLMLLARAAPYAKNRDNYSTLFNIETMDPLVSGPPFVQALEELVAASKLGPTDPFHYDPNAARAAFWKGQCGMALTWPTAAEQGTGERGERRGERGLVASATSSLTNSATSSANAQIRVGFAELPGSPRVFNLGGRVWDNRADDDDPRVPLLAIAGRLGVVSAKSARPDAAFQLLLWLSDDRMSLQISTASPATTLFRQSHLKSPGRWAEKPVSATAAVQYGDATAATLRRQQWLGALRFSGRAEYLAALDKAVVAAVRGEKPAIEAMLYVDKNWREITARHGLERQRAAYRHSLGLE